MIEIKADSTLNGQFIVDHTFINQNKISAIENIVFDERCFYINKQDIPGYRFSIVLDGAFLTFKYLKFDICEAWHKLIFNAINLE